MISPQHARLMARYNRWQNKSLYGAADDLSDPARLKDRGAFFHSIHETLAHILWADRVWLSRFGCAEAPAVKGNETLTIYPVWKHLKVARIRMDGVLDNWVNALDDEALGKNLVWYSGAAGKEMSKPVWELVTHIFNHQAHHRGQVHAMLTMAGVVPDDTDLFLMPH
jgi:uncharacterized damage-inducible protein DinB